MNLNKITSLAISEFKQKFSEFCDSKEFKSLSSASARDFSQGLQLALSETGKRAYQLFLENFEDTRDIICKDGKRLRFKQVSKKKFLTPFGEIVLGRRLYQADNGGKSFFPLDAQWGVENEYASPEVREAVCFTAGLVTPVEAVDIFSKSSLFHPSSTAIKHIISKTGRFVEENKEEINTSIRNNEIIPLDTKAVVFSLDGVNVLLNEPGPRKGRKIQRPKLGYQNNEKTSFKNAMVGSISFYGREKGKPKRIRSVYSSQMPEENFLSFRDQFENEIRDVNLKLPENVKKILIIDGHHSLRGYVSGNPIFKNCEYLIDFYHAMEHVSLSSELIFGKSNPTAKAWFRKWKKELLENENSVLKLIRSLDYYAKGLKMEDGRILRRERKYFLKRKSQMNYAWFAKRALPIGSGPVEAACKSIVKTRLCRSGMRWSRDGGQNILNFRTYIKSERWESFWKYYENWKIAA